MHLRVFTAFSGYDSQCMALDRLCENSDFSYELVGWSEIDKYAIHAHNAVYPQWADRNYGDVTKIDWSGVPNFDLFTYSSPCQDFSQAGRQAGAVEGSGTRSSLLWECRRAIVAKRPKYLLFENVAAVASSKFVRLFNKWQLELESYGYKNFTKVLNAKDYDVPQNRERIFMLSILDENARYEFPKPMRLTKCLRDVLETNVPERYYLSDERLKGVLESTAKQAEKGNGFAFEPTDGRGIAHTIGTLPANSKTDNYIIEGVQIVGNLQPNNLWGESIRQQNQIVGTQGLSPAITAEHARHEFKIAEPTVLGWTRDEKGEVVDRHPVDIANAVTAAKRDNTQNYVVEPLISKDKRLRKFVDEHGGEITDGAFIDAYNQQANAYIAGTITCGIDSRNREFVSVMGSSAYRIRKLTERECFRLMDVSDADIGKIQACGVSRSQQYKLAGNSIVVSVLYHIFDKVFLHTEITEPTLF